jgi:cholesterol oxidase
VAADGTDLYLRNLHRLQMPMTFLHGAHNRVWVPESTRRTYDVLTSRFGPDRYRRVVLKDNGHQDCLMGAGAVDTGFPVVLDHLLRAGA